MKTWIAFPFAGKNRHFRTMDRGGGWGLCLKEAIQTPGPGVRVGIEVLRAGESCVYNTHGSHVEAGGLAWYLVAQEVLSHSKQMDSHPGRTMHEVLSLSLDPARPAPTPVASLIC